MDRTAAVAKRVVIEESDGDEEEEDQYGNWMRTNTVMKRTDEDQYGDEEDEDQYGNADTERSPSQPLQQQQPRSKLVLIESESDEEEDTMPSRGVGTEVAAQTKPSPLPEEEVEVERVEVTKTTPAAGVSGSLKGTAHPLPTDDLRVAGHFCVLALSCLSFWLCQAINVCMCACVRACVRACMHACVRACVNHDTGTHSALPLFSRKCLLFNSDEWDPCTWTGKMLCDEGIEQLLRETVAKGSGGPWRINLSCNGLTCRAVQLLCDTIRTNSWGMAPMDLDLSDNYLEDSAAPLIGELIKQGLVYKVDLSSNDLSSAAVADLQLASLQAVNLRVLNLGSNDLDDIGAAALSRVLAEETCCLDTLNLSNTGIQHAGLRLIAAAMSKRGRITQVYVDDNGCNDAVLDLARVPSLSFLSLRNAGITDSIARQLALQLTVDPARCALQIDCRNNFSCTEVGRTALQGVSKMCKSISIVL